MISQREASFQTPCTKKRTPKKRKTEKLQADPRDESMSQVGLGTIAKNRWEKLQFKQEGANLRELNEVLADQIDRYR